MLSRRLARLISKGLLEAEGVFSSRSRNHFTRSAFSVCQPLDVVKRDDFCTASVCFPWRPSSCPTTDSRAGFATETKAEEYNLITAEPGLVSIDLWPKGFLVNGIEIKGSVLCYGDLYTSWDVQSTDDITPDSLALLLLIKPIPDILVLGMGTSHTLPEATRHFLRDHGIGLEVTDTVNAVATFNILNQEGRKVAGGLLPID